MTRKARKREAPAFASPPSLARRKAEVLFNEPATRRGAGAAPTRRAARILSGALLLVSQGPQWVLLRSSRRAPSQNSQQRCYTSLRLGAPVASPVVTFAPSLDVRRRIARERVPTSRKRHRQIKSPKLGLLLRDALHLTCPCP